MAQTSGIYTIYNKVSCKYYVGQSTNCEKRIRTHKYTLQRNIHPNKHLQEAWEKYGSENFEFDILQEYPQALLIDMEHYWCNMLNTHDNAFGYNKAVTGVVRKFLYTEKQKELHQLRMCKLYAKSIIMLDKKNNKLREFQNIKEAAECIGKYNKKTASMIRACLSKKTKTAYGYVFVYKSEYDPEKDYRPRFIYKNPLKKGGPVNTVYQFDKTGTLVKTYRSESDANRYFNKYAGFIKNKINFKHFHEEFVFSYQPEIDINEFCKVGERRRQIESKQKPVYQLDDDLNIIKEFNTPADVLLYFKKPREKMRSLFTALMKNAKNPKSIHTAYGFKWVYKENYHPNLKLLKKRNNKEYYDIR